MSLANSSMEQYIRTFLVGCACALIVILGVWMLWSRLTLRDRLRVESADSVTVQSVTGIVETTGAAAPGIHFVCVCPSCGTTVTQTREANCTKLLCPLCGAKMVRPRSVLAWRELVFRPIVIESLIVVFVALIIHYVVWGPKRLAGRLLSTVKRFSPGETVAHFLVMFSFVLLAITGMAGIIGPGSNMSTSLGGNSFLLLHYAAAAIFAAGLVTVGMLWIHDCLFNKNDMEWLRHAGGFFGYKGQMPAGRFNGGQKAFFWFVGVLGIIMMVTGYMRLFPVQSRTTQQAAYIIHDAVALTLILTVLIHTYLGTAANPGSWQAVFSGWVTEEWAKTHHPNWKHELEVPNHSKGTPIMAAGPAVDEEI